MSLPTELVEHVILLSSDEWFDLLVPRRAGSCNNAFFFPNEETYRIPTVETRRVDVPIPTELLNVYQRYPDDTEFSAPHGWMFLSEREIATRRDAMRAEGSMRLVDIGFVYAGMGHVKVVSYDPETKGVLTSVDGGANAWDRKDNHERRVRMTVAPTTPFATWWKTEGGQT
jgi:hypothetical protein